MAILFQLIGRLIKWTAIAIIYLTPVLGVWLGSSLAAYNNRSTSLAVLAGGVSLSHLTYANRPRSFNRFSLLLTKVLLMWAGAVMG
ncbi:hypothetical protein [Nostoc sp.]